MYQKFFGFDEKPFDVTPDPRFLYLSEHHQEALASIIYGIRERRGFITLVGEVGTGKTTLLNATMESLDENTQTAFIFNTDVNFDDLLQMVLMEFDLSAPDEFVPKYVALDRLNRFATGQFAKGGNVVLLIDEAQNLDTRTMENLRLLSNLETRRHKLIQIVLSGQPELDEKLRKNELRQLAQRINMRRYIMPLNESDTYQYILQHLGKAGYKGKQLFDRASLRQIWEFSRGVPRKINLLCDNTLLIAYGLGKKKITRAIVDEAVRDLNWSPYEIKPSGAHRSHQPDPEYLETRPFGQRQFGLAAILLLSLVIGAGSFGFLHMNSDGIRQYLSGIFGFNGGGTPGGAELERHSAPEAHGGTVEPGIKGAGEGSGQADAAPSALAPEKLAELPEHAEIIIEEFTVSERDRQTSQAPAPPRAIDSPEGAEKTAAPIKKPKAAVTSPERRGIIEEDLLIMPRASHQPSANSSGTGTSAAYRTPSTSLEQGASRTVVVRKHDYLARIIRANYGTISEDLLKKVLQANPTIRNPDIIVPGQVIRLPDIGAVNEKISDSSTGISKKKLTRNST